MDYVVGFVFIGEDNKKILLQLKNRGNDYLNGKFNGLGGKIEENETVLNAMAREYEEETGDERDMNWYHFLTIHYPNGVNLNILVSHVDDHFYDNINWNSSDPNAEELFIFKVAGIAWDDCVNNLKYIIPLIHA